jgi:hypothetical protein
MPAANFAAYQAEDLAAWLGAHLHGAQVVERERFPVVPHVGDDRRARSNPSHARAPVANGFASE